MELTVDSHALFWYLDQNKQTPLSNRARAALNQAKVIYIPSIVLLEVLFIFEKYVFSEKFRVFLKRVRQDLRFKIKNLDLKTVTMAQAITGVEMHDRVIIVTAKQTRTFLVTKDREIHQVYQSCLW